MCKKTLLIIFADSPQRINVQQGEGKPFTSVHQGIATDSGLAAQQSYSNLGHTALPPKLQELSWPIDP
jgi:hypothetical protein